MTLKSIISMTTGCRAVLTTCILLSFTQTQLSADENWPQWRGPSGNGVALSGTPPIEWSETKNVKWKVPVAGSGHSTPIIFGNKVLLMTAVSDKPAVNNEPEAQEQPQNRGERGFGRPGRGFGATVPTETHHFITLCLDKKDGSVIWKKTSRSQKPIGGKHQTNTYSSGSPVTDGEVVVANFSSYGTYCYDLNGNLKWEKDLGNMRTRAGFGEGSSAAIHKNLVYVLWDTEDDSFLYALNKNSGDIVWKVERDEATGWTTPFVLTHKGVAQVIVNASNRIRSYHAMTGKLIWECGGQTTNAIPTVVADEFTVYAMSGYRGNSAMAIELGGSGDLTNSDKVLWTLDRGTPYVPSPVLYNGLLYFCKRNDGFLTCVETVTGAVLYGEERIENISGVYASPVAANGHIYLPGQNGYTAVIKAGNELNVVATNKLDEPINASPAISGNALFLRSSSHLYCISE